MGDQFFSDIHSDDYFDLGEAFFVIAVAGRCTHHKIYQFIKVFNSVLSCDTTITTV
jgi:hypothetical protein